MKICRMPTTIWAVVLEASLTVLPLLPTEMPGRLNAYWRGQWLIS